VFVGNRDARIQTDRVQETGLTLLAKAGCLFLTNTAYQDGSVLQSINTFSNMSNTHTHTLTRTHTHTQIYAPTHTNVHTHTYAGTHTHTQSYTYKNLLSLLLPHWARAGCTQTEWTQLESVNVTL